MLSEQGMDFSGAPAELNAKLDDGVFDVIRKAPWREKRSTRAIGEW